MLALMKSFPEVKTVKAFFDETGEKRPHILLDGHEIPKKLKEKIELQFPTWDMFHPELNDPTNSSKEDEPIPC